MMDFSLKDIGALGRPLLIVVVVLALCAGGVYYTNRLLAQGRTALTAAEGQLNEARKRVQQSGEERDMISTYVGPYMALAERGVVGEEHRLSWVEALRAANNQAKLYGVEYEVGAQQPYSFAGEAQAQGIPVQQSLMKLKFGILYEDDLLGFFRALQAQNVGSFSVNQCVLERLSREISRPSNAPTLRAECEVAWITIPTQSPEGNS
jgi:hypothetical protein